MENSDGLAGSAPTPDEAARRIKDAAGSVMDRTKQAAADTAQRGKESLTSSVQTAASSLRRAADETQDDNAMIGNALRSVADGLDKASRSLEGNDLSQGLGQINGFARREPAIFLGASFALGFALARVGKAAVERSADAAPQSMQPPGGFGG